MGKRFGAHIGVDASERRGAHSSQDAVSAPVETHLLPGRREEPRLFGTHRFLPRTSWLTMKCERNT
ncbi:MAG: hypothetical protein IKH88_13120 [Prevotella sp.]|nr:hypothetical protein [Prevotella sp.]